MNRRYTRSTKRQLAVLIDWLGSKGHAAATRAIMSMLSLSSDELAEVWTSRRTSAFARTGHLAD
jgi:hypothetical protein